MKISEKITAIALRNKRYFLLLASLVPIVIWSYVIYGARALRLEGTALGVCLGIHLLSCVLSSTIKREVSRCSIGCCAMSSSGKS